MKSKKAALLGGLLYNFNRSADLGDPQEDHLPHTAGGCRKITQ
jgi:hypothetical protein